MAPRKLDCRSAAFSASSRLFDLNDAATRARNKNSSPMVLSIVFRSLSGKRPLTEARDILIQRLHSLARSQSVLIAERFEGAPLAEIVRLEFESFSDRVKAVGPHLMVNPRMTQTFALVVHELDF